MEDCEKCKKYREALEECLDALEGIPYGVDNYQQDCMAGVLRAIDRAEGVLYYDKP